MTVQIPEVDAYIARSAVFAQPVLRHLREAVHEAAPGVVEDIKWSRPFFVYRGVILGNMSAFKAHCSFGVWGPEIATALRSGGVAKADAMGSLGRITAVEDLPPRKLLLGYIKLAAKAIDDGVRTKSWTRAQPKVAKADAVVPEALSIALKKNKAAATSFASMSPSCRREYCAWIAAAKREDTLTKRVATAIEWIAEGKARHWKYA